MKTIAYKVARNFNKKEGFFYSAIVDQEARVKYRIGEVSISPHPAAPLMAFQDSYSAESFIRHYFLPKEKTSILKCEVSAFPWYRFTDQGWLFTPSDLASGVITALKNNEVVPAHWQKKNWQGIANTLYCEFIKPIEIIK